MHSWCPCWQASPRCHRARYDFNLSSGSSPTERHPDKEQSGESPAPYLVVVGGDEPQLQVQVVVALLHADKVEDVLVLHAAHAVDLVLILPRQPVLETRGDGYGCQSCYHLINTACRETSHLRKS